jgi:adenylate cyclase
MAANLLPRKLAAILHADVVGFSRLTEQDEDATLRGLRDCFDVFNTTIARYRGRVINRAGDAVLATFGSALDALSCTARIQAAVADCNASLPEGRRIRFRVGLNLGDVIGDRGDIFGDGVNVAARLQSLAEPGGICISGSVHDAVGSRLPFDYEYLGEQQVKNIAKPVRAYHARLKAGADVSDLPAPAAPARLPQILLRPAGAVVLALIVALAGFGAWQFWPDQPATETAGTRPADGARLPVIAVLPFINRSSDPEQAYFADGVTEDIITDLSALSGLVVVSRGASFQYKGVEVVPQEAGKELGADYLLEGSVRKAGGQVRITAQLVSTKDGIQAWAERYDHKLADLFALQDDVTHNIVKAMAIHLTPQEEKQLERAPTSDFEAYDLFLRGQKLYGERTREASKGAIDAYRRAIELDPDFARAYGGLAVALTMDYRRGWTDAPQESLDRALVMADKAVALDPGSPHAYWALGFTHLFRKEYEEAAGAAERSVELAPNYADGYGLLAFINNHLGRADQAIAQITKAMELNPHYTFDYPWNLGWAYYTLGRYPKAVESLSEALERNDNAINVHVYLAASYEALGQHDDAEWEVDRIRVISPATTLSEVAKTSALSDPSELKKLLSHLRAAGLPE